VLRFPAIQHVPAEVAVRLAPPPDLGVGRVPGRGDCDAVEQRRVAMRPQQPALVLLEKPGKRRLYPMDTRGHRQRRVPLAQLAGLGRAAANDGDIGSEQVAKPVEAGLG
jgi:hypothetical protein